MNHQKRNQGILPGFLFTSILGTLAHFLYQWTGENRIVGLFSAVNESTWEHMKLLFFPMLLFCLLAHFFSASGEQNSAACFAGVLSGTLLIPVLFYTYSGILGFSVPVINILIFYLSVLAAFLVRSRCHFRSCLFAAAIILLFFCFLVFTYTPPSLGIFQPPTQEDASGTTPQPD